MARAYWRGHLKLSLVSIAVELYSAVESSSRLSLHQIHAPTQKRIRYEKVAPGVGPVDKEEIVKGFEVDKDEYVLLEPDELDQIRLASKETIDLVQFVDHCEIDPRYYDRPYYVVPRGGEVAGEGFVVIREALRRAGKVALGQMASRGRDYVVAIKPCGAGLLLETLRYAQEVRESDSIFRDVPDIEVDKDMIGLATELIERKSAPFDANAFKSQYTQALRELIEQKRTKGKVASASDEELRGGRDNVIDLMDALKKSVASGKQKGSRGGSRKKTARKSGSKRARA